MVRFPFFFSCSIPTLDDGASLVSPCRIEIHSESRPIESATRSCHPSDRQQIRALRLEGDIPCHAELNPNICVFRERSDLASANVRGEVPRTAGAPRALAREVPDGRGYLDRSVRTLVPSAPDVDPWSASPSSFLVLFPRWTVEPRWSRLAGLGFTQNLVPSNRQLVPAILRADNESAPSDWKTTFLPTLNSTTTSVSSGSEATYDPRTSAVRCPGRQARLVL